MIIRALVLNFFFLPFVWISCTFALPLPLPQRVSQPLLPPDASSLTTFSMLDDTSNPLVKPSAPALPPTLSPSSSLAAAPSVPTQGTPTLVGSFTSTTQVIVRSTPSSMLSPPSITSTFRFSSLFSRTAFSSTPSFDVALSNTMSVNSDTPASVTEMEIVSGTDSVVATEPTMASSSSFLLRSQTTRMQCIQTPPVTRFLATTQFATITVVSTFVSTVTVNTNFNGMNPMITPMPPSFSNPFMFPPSKKEIRTVKKAINQVLKVERSMDRAASKLMGSLFPTSAPLLASNLVRNAFAGSSSPPASSSSFSSPFSPSSFLVSPSSSNSFATNSFMDPRLQSPMIASSSPFSPAVSFPSSLMSSTSLPNSLNTNMNSLPSMNSVTNPFAPSSIAPMNTNMNTNMNSNKNIAFMAGNGMNTQFPVNIIN